MAEFAEVMLQTVRMCESMANCETCPLFTHDDCGEHICPFTWSEMPTMEYFHRVEKKRYGLGGEKPCFHLPHMGRMARRKFS